MHVYLTHACLPYPTHYTLPTPTAREPCTSLPNHQTTENNTNTNPHHSAVHLYFVIKEILDAFKPGGRYPSACPQCQHIPFPQISVKFRGDGSGKDGYKPLLDGEGRPAAAVNAEDDAV